MTSTPEPNPARGRPAGSTADGARPLEDVFTVPPDDAEAPHLREDLPALTGAAPAVLDALHRAGLLLPHHVADDGSPRSSERDVAAIGAGLRLLDAGLPLAALLELAEQADAVLGGLAEHVLEAFLRFVRDPLVATTEITEDRDPKGSGGDPGGPDAEAAALVHAYTVMLPATEQLVAHQLRRRLIAAAVARLSERVDDAPSTDHSAPR